MSDCDFTRCESGRDFFGVDASFLSVGDFVTSLIDRLAFIGPGFFLIPEFPAKVYKKMKVGDETIIQNCEPQNLIKMIIE